MPAPSTGTPTANSTWRLDVDLDHSSYSGNWSQVKGMSNFVPGKNDTVSDMSDYDTDGWGADAVMQQKWQNTGTVRRHTSSGSRDAGQEALRAAANGLYLLHVRWYERTTGGEAYEGYALVQWTPGGGDAAGIEEVNFVLLGQSSRTAITSPYSATAVPVVNSVSPATGAAAGGTTGIVITGSGFTGTVATTGVKFGATNATSWVVVSDTIIVAVSPAHAAGTVTVVVTNANGPSVDNGTADDYVYV